LELNDKELKLIKLLRKIKSVFISRYFIVFTLLGFVNTFNTSVISWVLSLVHVQENVSAIIGYLVSLQGAFLLNCKFVFICPPSLKRYERFLISYIPSFIVYILLHAGSLSIFGSQFWATFIAVALSGPITFVIIKLYAFGKTQQKDEIICDEKDTLDDNRFHE